MLDGRCERAGDLVGHGLAERRRKGRRRLADQIGLGDARKIRPQRLDAAFLGQAADDPVDAREARQRRRRRIGVGRLRIIDEEHMVLAPHLLHAVCQARKALKSGLDLAEVEADLEAGGDGGERVLRIVLAAQRPDAFQEADPLVAPVDRLHQIGAVGEIAVGQWQALGNADDGLAGLLQPVGDLRAIDVVHADDRRVAARHQTFLDGGVVLHRPVPVEMIRRQVEQDAGGRVDRRRQVDLVGRAFDHIGAVGRQWIERHHRAPDIAAHLRVASGGAQYMGGQRRRRRLAVRAGDRDEGRCRRLGGSLAREKLDIADDLDASATRQFHRPVRLGMRERHAGRQDEGRESWPCRAAQVRRRG